jgi:hypothetical protein
MFAVVMTNWAVAGHDGDDDDDEAADEDLYAAFGKVGMQNKGLNSNDSCRCG